MNSYLKMSLSEGKLLVFLWCLGVHPEVFISPVIPQKQRHPKNIGPLRHAHPHWLELLVGSQVESSKLELWCIRNGFFLGEGAVGSESSRVDVH